LFAVAPEAFLQVLEVATVALLRPKVSSQSVSATTNASWGPCAYMLTNVG